MRFRTSNLLLLVLAVALAVGWYVDRNRDKRTDFLGQWYYPTNEDGVFGYTSLIDFGPNGTFKKIQGYRTSYETFVGTYNIDENGRIDVHITKKTSGCDISKMLSEIIEDAKHVEPKTTELDAYFNCRCAIAPTGQLIIDARERSLPGSDVGLRWETHARDTNYIIRGRPK